MKKIRQHLGWKLFFSYLIVIFIGVFSLAIIAEWHAPTALSRHMASMQMMMDGSLSDSMATNLLENFRTAVNEVLLVSAVVAVITAVIISSFVTRRIVQPIQEMTTASQRIANGRYDERVQVSGEDELAELGVSFNRMAHQLEQTEERRRQLIGDVAHELRTPLSSIKSVMEGLQDGVLPADPATFASVEHEIIGAEVDGEQVRLAVQDTGIGLTAEQQRHIFERFYRVDKSRARTGGGSGIGLTISKHIVEAHHGRLTVTSPGPGKGSAFTVSLPSAA